MVLFPNCKINLGLRVLDKRNDGYHNLDTVFYPLPLKDAAELNYCSLLKKESRSDFDLSTSGIPIPGDATENLCIKAWCLIRSDFPDLPPLKMHLLKSIPPGAGLGGGSSNGAFTLLLLNQLLRLNLSTEKLLHYALQLGSDCPFFIINKPAHATGRGEVIEEINVQLHDHYFILVHPGIHVNTGWAFSKLKPGRKVGSTKDIIAQPVTQWKDQLVNDFEEPVFEEYPQLRYVKEKLYASGAVYASMTGTGSCIYGIFNNSTEVKNLRFSDDHKVFQLKSCV